MGSQEAGKMLENAATTGAKVIFCFVASARENFQLVQVSLVLGL